MYEVTLFFSLACFLAVAFAFGRSPAFSIFHPLTIYLAFHGFIFVFRPIIAHIMQFDFVYRVYQFTPSASDKITALLASTLGLLTFAFGCHRAGNVPMQFRFDRIAAAERTWLTPAFLAAIAICGPIGIYSLATVWDTAVTTGSAYSNMIRMANVGKAYNEGTNGYLVEAQLMLASCAAILAWLFRFRLLALVPLAVFAVYRAGTGGRGPFITAFVAVALLYLYERRRRFPPALLLALLPVALIAFTAVGDDRGATIRRALADDTSSAVFGSARVGERFLEGMDFANLEYLEYVIYVVPQRSGTYGYFNDVLQVFTEPVPRALWPDKPIGAPLQRINFFDYGKPSGMTISLPGEGWYSLGWAGVVLWCGLCGWLLGAIYKRFVQGPQSTIQVAAYMIFLPVLIVAFRDGQLVTVFRQGLFFLLPIGLWWLIARLFGAPALARMRVKLGSVARRPQAGLRGPIPAPPPAVLRRRRALLERASD